MSGYDNWKQTDTVGEAQQEHDEVIAEIMERFELDTEEEAEAKLEELKMDNFNEPD
jgi:hypothetical protein